MPQRVLRLMRIRVSTPIWLYIIVFGLLVLGAIKIEQLVNKTEQITQKTQNLAKENTKRINDIQASRVYSCQRTYQSFHDVLDPFVGPQTPKEDIRQFDKIISDKIENCTKQVRRGSGK